MHRVTTVCDKGPIHHTLRLLQATGGDQQMLDMLVEATASHAAADRWRWKDADMAQTAAVIEVEASEHC